MLTRDKKQTIMIVDDTPANLELLAEMLQMQGYRTVQFPSGSMALKAAVKDQPDLILLDIMMPKLNGFQVCQKLKDDDKLKEIPVIFISALNDTANKVRAFTHGGVDYVTKPFQEKEVMSRVRTHLELQRQKQEIKKLLGKTLVGAIKALNEVLAITCPESYRKTLKIGQYMRVFCQQEKLDNAWMFEVAANLSNLGNLVPALNTRGIGETTVQFSNLPANLQENVFNEAANIVRCIPSLENVAAMVEKSAAVPDTNDHWRTWPLDLLGGHLLAIAFSFESHLEKGYTVLESLKRMSKQKEPIHFNPQLLHDFGRVIFKVDISGAQVPPQDIPADYIADSQIPTQETRVKVEVGPMGLEPDQILAEDLIAPSGVMILSKGTQLTKNLCALIQKRHQANPFNDTIKVYTHNQQRS